MNVGEYGLAHNLNVNYNISAFTTLSMVYTRPDGTLITRTGADVTVPAVALVTTDMGTFAANQYAKHIFKVGDLTLAGTYTVRLTYTDATKRLVSDQTSFVVSA